MILKYTSITSTSSSFVWKKPENQKHKSIIFYLTTLADLVIGNKTSFVDSSFVAYNHIIKGFLSKWHVAIMELWCDSDNHFFFYFDLFLYLFSFLLLYFTLGCFFPFLQGRKGLHSFIIFNCSPSSFNLLKKSK